jgi:hypothetical protein
VIEIILSLLFWLFLGSSCFAPTMWILPSILGAFLSASVLFMLDVRSWK